MKHILEKIKEYNTIIIHGHIRPDGDCIGSQYGLYNIIKTTWPEKKVYVTGDVCEYVAFLGKPSHVDEALFKGALSICVDCATADRLSDQRFNLSDYTIKIDHHIVIDNYGDYQYVEENASSCCEIITRFYQMFKDELKLNKEGATALLTGINTDTGNFSHDDVTAKTFYAAGELMNFGVDLEYISNNLSVESLDTLKLKGYCLSNFKMTENGFAYICLHDDVIKASKVSLEEAASMVSAISTIDGCPVWAILLDYPTEIRIRLRSRGPEIDKIANMYEGGGHSKAAGAKLKSWDDLDGFVKICDDAVRVYKEKLQK